MKLKTICIIGLSLFVISYWIFTKGNEFAHSQKQNRKNCFYTNNPGSNSFIGLNTIDFISWSFGDDNNDRNVFFNQLASTPSIAFPFVYVGPSLLFLGLSTHALNFIKSNPIGYMLTVSGAVFMGLGYFLWNNLVYTALGCTVFAIGLIFILRKLDEKQNLCKSKE